MQTGSLDDTALSKQTIMVSIKTHIHENVLSSIAHLNNVTDTIVVHKQKMMSLSHSIHTNSKGRIAAKNRSLTHVVAELSLRCLIRRQDGLDATIYEYFRLTYFSDNNENAQCTLTLLVVVICDDSCSNDVKFFHLKENI